MGVADWREQEEAHAGVRIPFLDMSGGNTDSTYIKTFCALLYFSSIKTYTRKLYKSSQKPEIYAPAEEFGFALIHCFSSSSAW